MDGPAFHRAGTALERARADDLPFALDLVERTAEATAVAETLARVHAVLMRRWTRAQLAAVRAMEDCRAQLAAAERLGITQQAVSDALRAAGWREVEAAERALRDWLGGTTSEGSSR
jgi:hypothetical protein